MTSLAQDTAFQTLEALEQRLERVRFLLYGVSTNTSPDDGDKDVTPIDTTPTQSVTSRLHALQSSFDSLLSDSKSAQEIVAIEKQHQHDAPDMKRDTLTSLILSHAPSYQATAARLTSLQDLPVPDPSSSAALIELHPRLQRAADRQEQQQHTIAQLRAQSVSILARWYETGIIKMDDCWTEWEGRLMQQEKLVRRAEAETRQEGDAV